MTEGRASGSERARKNGRGLPRQQPHRTCVGVAMFESEAAFAFVGGGCMEAQTVCSNPDNAIIKDGHDRGAESRLQRKGCGCVVEFKLQPQPPSSSSGAALTLESGNEEVRALALQEQSGG